MTSNQHKRNQEELKMMLKKIVNDWNDPSFLIRAGEQYIKESEEISQKEFDSWQKSIHVWVR